MPRYIDADLLLRKAIQERRFFICTENLIKGGYDVQTVYNDLAEFVESIPTADVVEVVRCKDCCWCIVTSPPYASAYCIKGLRNIIVEPDDFCSHGERKE